MHYLLTEAIELSFMQGFCHVISNHLICQTVFDVNVALSDVQMMRALASTLASVGLEQHGTFIVLIEDILLDWISLCFKK